jgi:mannose-6-phosphate isomerase
MESNYQVSDQVSPAVYPMLLQPEFHERVWGGQRLADVLGAELPDGKIGESWSMGADNLILNGPLAGKSLGTVASTQPDLMLGSVVLASGRTDLPLLFKVLDAQELLSIQVHPDDQQALEMEHMPYGKSEAWYCLDATPGAYVIHGFSRPVTLDEVRNGLADGGIVNMLRKIELRPGESILVPAGTVHAIGGGLLLGEIQENSNITYRLYDWGRPREMHIEQGSAVLDPEPPGFSVSEPLRVNIGESVVRYLLACNYFLYQEITVQGQLDRDTRGCSFHSLFCFEGKGELRYLEAESGQEQALTFAQGQTIFVPAALGAYTLEGAGCKLLNSSVPDLENDVIAPLLDAGYQPDKIGALGGRPGNELEQLISAC